jgi:hypothetical protein
MSDESLLPLEATVLTVEIHNKRPLELIDLTKSLLAVGEEYRRFVTMHPEAADASEVKLCVKEVRSGSAIFDLIPVVAAGVLPFVHETNSIVSFGRFLSAAYSYLTGKSETKPDLQKADLTNLNITIEPVAKDNGAQINFITVVNNTIHHDTSINSHEANEAQNVISRELAQLKEPETNSHKKAVLYWYQARDDARSKAGDRGIIESISPSPVKIEFDGEQIKDAMLHGLENPFRTAYIVDVDIETINGKPVLYKTTRYHGRFDKPGESTQSDMLPPSRA